MKTTMYIVASLFLCGSVAWAETPEVISVDTVEVESPSLDQMDTHFYDRVEASPQQMAGIWHSLRAAKTEAGRVSVLMYVSKNYWLRTVQAEALVEMINDYDSRANLLVAIYPRLTNPERFNKLLELLPEEAQRQATLGRVGIQVTASL